MPVQVLRASAAPPPMASPQQHRSLPSTAARRLELLVGSPFQWESAIWYPSDHNIDAARATLDPISSWRAELVACDTRSSGQCFALSMLFFCEEDGLFS